MDKRDRELQNLKEENERLQARLSLLSEVSRRISSSLDLEAVLQEVVDAACQLTSARYGALGVFDDSGNLQAFITHGITEEERKRIGDPPKGLRILGWLQHLQKPIRLANLADHPRSVGFPQNHPPMRSFLGVPIRHGGDRLGNLYLTEKQDGKEFTPEDENLLVLFAAQAAMAIRNAGFHQSVAAQRSRLEALVNTSPVGVFVVEAPDQQIVLVNREA